MREVGHWLCWPADTGSGHRQPTGIPSCRDTDQGHVIIEHFMDYTVPLRQAHGGHLLHGRVAVHEEDHHAGLISGIRGHVYAEVRSYTTKYMIQVTKL
jgi:hypothetical protein